MLVKSETIPGVESDTDNWVSVIGDDDADGQYIFAETTDGEKIKLEQFPASDIERRCERSIEIVNIWNVANGRPRLVLTEAGKHLKDCDQCRDHPFDLCPTGKALFNVQEPASA